MQRVEQLALPFQCVAASIERAAEHWFTEGVLSDVVLASCSVPGVLPPVAIGDEHFIDGGIVNSIPVARAVALGARTIYVLQVGRLERPLQPPRWPWEVGLVAFEVARRHRFCQRPALAAQGGGSARAAHRRIRGARLQRSRRPAADATDRPRSGSADRDLPPGFAAPTCRSADGACGRTATTHRRRVAGGLGHVPGRLPRCSSASPRSASAVSGRPPAAHLSPAWRSTTSGSSSSPSSPAGSCGCASAGGRLMSTGPMQRAPLTPSCAGSFTPSRSAGRRCSRSPSERDAPGEADRGARGRRTAPVLQPPLRSRRHDPHHRPAPDTLPPLTARRVQGERRPRPVRRHHRPPPAARRARQPTTARRARPGSRSSRPASVTGGSWCCSPRAVTSPRSAAARALGSLRRTGRRREARPRREHEAHDATAAQRRPRRAARPP